MTLLRDLIEIPERVDPGKFVLRLTEGVDDPARTLGDYVVTENLAEAYDDALALVSNAVAANNSRATYLHGSFGSGKSHFMAVLDLLLSGNAAARAIAELAPTIAKHDEWLSGEHGSRKFLVVPLYLMNARSLEHGIFSGYVAHLAKLHPDAPPPAVYPAERLLANADALRSSMGDGSFFDALNQATTGQSDGWGDLASDWDTATYSAARAARAGDPEQIRLVGDLTATLLPAYAELARSSADAYVGLDDGLSALSHHAASLGYHGLVLFLDELVLWLISQVANVELVTREASKLSTLVESANPDRPVPVVSFVARQRDLSELVGRHSLGNEYAALRERLDHVSGRFGVIPLEDRNLPAIARHRLLRPRDAVAKEQITAAFGETRRFRPDVLRTMLGTNGDPAQFEQIYPFSPAFMETLVAVSGALQRERTALQVMLQLLVDRRDDLELGQVVPVGDLWDAIVAGDTPFEPRMKERFATAKRLYRNTLRPLLLDSHGLADDEAEKLPRLHAFVAADRLVKTLLLAALVPEVEPFRDLTVDRLAALNHGAIDTPLPGAENREVLTILRLLQSGSGAVRLGEDTTNPTVSVVIEDVDTAGIIASQRHVDSRGARQQLVRAAVENELGFVQKGELRQVHQFVWKGTRRSVELIFANVRDTVELPNSVLDDQSDEWKVVIDYPFDEPGMSPRHDLERILSLRGRDRTSNVLCWLPTFLSGRMNDNLGKLVVIDYLLSGDRFDQAADHLSVADRTTARHSLEAQQTELQRQLTDAIHQAYGIAPHDESVVDTALSPADSFPTLHSSLQVRPPVAATLGGAFEKLLDQLLGCTYPAHPTFGREIRTADLRKVLAEVRRAFQDPHQRIVPEAGMRPLLRDIATPLKLGEQSEQAFVADQFWLQHVIGVIARAGDGGRPVTVGTLRASFEEPVPRGLPREVEDLVLLAVCEKLGYSFRRHGGPYRGEVGNLLDELELWKQPLPDPDVWNRARANAEVLFGIKQVNQALLPANVDELRALVLTAAGRVSGPHHELVVKLDGRSGTYGISVDTDRRRTARVAEQLVDDLLAANADGVLDVLATAEPATTMQALGRSLAAAESVSSLLDDDRWVLVDRVATSPDGRALRSDAADGLAADEMSKALFEVLHDAHMRATDLVTDRRPLPPSPEPPPPVEVPPGPADQPVRSDQAAQDELEVTPDSLDDVVARLRQALAAAPGRKLRVWWRAE